jgi:hypothetical protein
MMVEAYSSDRGEAEHALIERLPRAARARVAAAMEVLSRFLGAEPKPFSATARVPHDGTRTIATAMSPPDSLTPFTDETTATVADRPGQGETQWWETACAPEQAGHSSEGNQVTKSSLGVGTEQREAQRGDSSPKLTLVPAVLDVEAWLNSGTSVDPEQIVPRAQKPCTPGERMRAQRVATVVTGDEPSADRAALRTPTAAMRRGNVLRRRRKPFPVQGLQIGKNQEMSHSSRRPERRVAWW